VSVNLSPVLWDLRHKPHLAVTGQNRNRERTTTLRTGVSGPVMDVYGPRGRAQFHVIDIARQMGRTFPARVCGVLLTDRESGPQEHAGTCRTTSGAQSHRMTRTWIRKPPQRNASGRGPELFVVVDNSELLPYNSMRFFRSTRRRWAGRVSRR